MGRTANDGRGRLGGRAKGTPNKPAAPFSEWAEGLLLKNRAFIEGCANSQTIDGSLKLLPSLIVAASIDRLTAQLAAMNQEPAENLNTPAV